MHEKFANLEERKINIYFDETGLQILPGDLLRVYHFTSGKTKRYMYHIADIDDTVHFRVMIARGYYLERPRYRLYTVCGEDRRIHGTKIIHRHDRETTRKKIKAHKQTGNEPS